MGLIGRSTKGRRTAKSSIYCSSDHFSEAKFHKALHYYEISHQINPIANPNEMTRLFWPIRNLILMVGTIDHLFLLDCLSSDNEQDVWPHSNCPGHRTLNLLRYLSSTHYPRPFSVCTKLTLPRQEACSPNCQGLSAQIPILVKVHTTHLNLWRVT